MDHPCNWRKNKKKMFFFWRDILQLTVKKLLFSISRTKRYNGEPDVIPTNCDAFIAWLVVSVWLKIVVEKVLNKISNASGTPASKEKA